MAIAFVLLVTHVPNVALVGTAAENRSDVWALKLAKSSQPQQEGVLLKAQCVAFHVHCCVAPMLDAGGILHPATREAPGIAKHLRLVGRLLAPDPPPPRNLS